MYESIQIANFRAFHAFDLKGLTRVNLLVGKNNAGKTSLLEAVEFVASRGRLTPLLRSARRRGEVDAVGPDERTGPQLSLAHVFHGHRISPDATLEVLGRSGGREQPVRVQVRPSQDRALSAAILGDASEPESLLEILISGPDRQNPSAQIIVKANGAVPLDAASLPVAHWSDVSPHVAFLGTRGANSRELQALWDQIVLTPEEGHVITALRTIEPTIERVAYVSRQGGQEGFVKLVGRDERLPLGSLGDGIRRLFALAIFLARASGGVLLVDEIDTGLHHTTLESMWRFVIETARRLDIQVFATSHSGDCIRSLAWLQTDAPELAGDVSVHRIDRGASASVRYSAEEIEVAARHHIEVRG